ncbi:MAG: thioredoxin-disulfide reductase [Candidatus Cloacimonas sp. 4484_140]|nr:MAG: thioredoxin-disulfide reductase [Candidatus Cloacimonas sp. 4484_140]HHI88012.1 thioredoxin-disulfide reductase [Candidatus Cloacimonadota bacterium]
MYDLIIIGGGPAGLTAGIYAARYKLKTVLIEKAPFAGGQLLKTSHIENYPGFDEAVLGYDLATKMENQAIRFGLEVKKETIIKIKFTDKKKSVYTEENEYHAKTAIIATGSQPRMLGVPGEKEFYGRGVSYCGTCDAPFFKDKVVAVIGGGNTAIEEALHIAKYASKVYIIHRRDELRADKICQEKAFAEEKIEVVWNSIIKSIDFQISEDRKITIFNKKTEKESKLKVDGVFIFIGLNPNTELIKGQIDLTHDGFIAQKPGEEMKTNVKGVFAAGDVRDKELRQIVNAAGDGAVAAFEANKYLTEHEV